MKGRQSSEGTPVTLSPGARGKMVQLRWWQLLITPHYHSPAELSRSWPAQGGLYTEAGQHRADCPRSSARE